MNKDNLNVQIPEKPSETSEISAKDYEYIRELLNEMRVQVVYLRNHLNHMLKTNFSLNSDTISDSLMIRKDKIKEMDTEELRRFLKNHQLKDGVYDEADREKLEEAMTIVKDSFITLASTEKEYSDIQTEADEITKEYYEFLNSVKTEEYREKKLQDAKILNESITDEIEKKKNSLKIEIIEKSYNHRFILDRLEKYGNEEVERLIKVYFDAKSGSYMINRYEDKIKRLGFSFEIYKNFFNIEETFLPEEYHPFNNLFLCVYMYWLSHIDPDREDDNLYAKSLTGAIANLIYHKFISDEKEKSFIELIKEVDNYFLDRKDYFIQYNDSYKENPKRIEVERLAKIQAYDVYKSKFEELNISDKFSEEKSIDELRTIYNAELNDIIESQITDGTKDRSETIDENNDVTGVEDGINELKESIQDGLETITRKENEAVEKIKDDAPSENPSEVD